LESSLPSPEPTENDLLQAGYRYAFALTHHREEAEDLVQETWLNLCRRYGRVENQAILFSSVKNLFIDQCRRKKVVGFDSLDQVEMPEQADPVAEEPCVKGELAALLGKLKPAEREMIFLHYYQGHTAEEISRMSGQSRGTVLSLIHRTISKLRKMTETSTDHGLRNQLMLWFVTLIVVTRFLRH
jgi:RNA polymerase sigma-70 factor (ECF subfamily)